nr:hypothetical protein [Flammeovirgaceae bacterium]
MNLYYKFTILYILTFIFFNQAISQNIVTYLGNSRVEQLNTVIQLTDGTYIASGSAEDLSWVIGSPGLNQLDPLTINNVGGGNSKIGMIIHLSDDLQELLNVVYFPSGAVQDIKHIKSNSPSGNSGDFFISGTTASGYFLAKLNNNFVNGIPTAIDWAYNVE